MKEQKKKNLCFTGMWRRELSANHLIPRTELYGISFPCLHIERDQHSSLTLSARTCSDHVGTVGAPKVLSCSFFLALQHPGKKQRPTEERGKSSPRAALSCSTTRNPELCTDTRQQQWQMFKGRSKIQSYRQAHGNSLAGVRTHFQKGHWSLIPL